MHSNNKNKIKKKKRIYIIYENINKNPGIKKDSCTYIFCCSWLQLNIVGSDLTEGRSVIRAAYFFQPVKSKTSARYNMFDIICRYEESNLCMKIWINWFCKALLSDSKSGIFVLKYQVY